MLLGCFLCQDLKAIVDCIHCTVYDFKEYQNERSLYDHVLKICQTISNSHTYIVISSVQCQPPHPFVIAV